MDRKTYLDINDDLSNERFENDSAYPWDESYIMSATEMDSIKRNLVPEKVFSADILVNSYRY